MLTGWSAWQRKPVTAETATSTGTSHMDPHYLLLKTVHITGVVIFLGNILVTAWWKAMADHTRDCVVIAYAQRQVTFTDLAFTSGGMALILAGGLPNAYVLSANPWSLSWLAWGMGLFIASGMIWVVILIPLQVRQARLARRFVVASSIPEEYWRLARRWYLWGALATALPLLNLYFMVFKPI